MSTISLTASMRSNLLSLQNISGQVDATQNKLSTGKKVNSAIDNPSSYYTALSLNNRADDLNALLDSMGQAVSTIKAATTALESATEFLEQAKAVANQALETMPEIFIPQPSGISDDAEIRNTSLFDGRSNTQAMIDQIGADALAATAANQFYAPGMDKDDANFGQGNWYLPAIGELMEMYGFDASEITNGSGTTGNSGNNIVAINDALLTLKNNGIDAEVFSKDYYWTSTEKDNASTWTINLGTGSRDYTYKGGQGYGLNVRCFSEVDISITDNVPKIGDVLYSDGSYGSADEYDSNKTVVGVISGISENGETVKIVNLKNLTFISRDNVNNFNPDAPYSGSVNNTYHTTTSKSWDDITSIEDYSQNQFLSAFQEAVSESSSQTKDNDAISQYTSILNQYDALVKDAGYKGVNLLQMQNLQVTFNEGRSSLLQVTGKDASSQTLGLVTLEWNSKEDAEKSIEELTNAINEIRSISSEFGNYYNIITTRQDFTENLINVLTEGADKLTLADMNEESANMLALQTRQQLAINSLSLASQASQSILKLF